MVHTGQKNQNFEQIQNHQYKHAIYQVLNSIGKIPSIIFGGFEFPLPTVKKKYDILIIGDVHIPVEVTQCHSKFLRFHVIRNELVNKT